MDETESEQLSSCEDGELKMTINDLPEPSKPESQVRNSTKPQVVIELD
jgi:hypothetical protein